MTGESEEPATELPRFSLLAQTVAGRHLTVIAGDLPRAFTDGQAVWVRAGDSNARLIAAVTVHAALTRIGSLEPSILLVLAGRRLSTLRYLTLEASRAVTTLPDLFPRVVVRLLKALYDGPVSRDATQSLRWSGQSRRRVPEAPEWLGTIRPIRVLRAHPEPGTRPNDTELAQAPRSSLQEMDDDQDSERSRILELFSTPLNTSLASTIQKFFEMGRAPGNGGGGGAELPVGGYSSGPVSTNAGLAVHVPPGATVPVLVPVGRSYPEWDYRHRRYLPDWCSVLEFDPPYPSADADRLSTYDGRLERALARIGLQPEPRRHRESGDELDLDSLVELFVDIASGVGGDARIYEARERTRPGLGVLVLLDTTGSTGESREGRRVFDEQRLLAARLTAALSDLGNRVAAYGFYSQGRHSVRFLRVKDFDDRFDSAAERRCVGLGPGGFTRLGAAIRHASNVLATRSGTTERLLVVIGDGLPYEEGYEHRYAQEDSRRALAEAVSVGTACAAVSVRGTTDPEILERVWGEVPHLHLEDASELADHVGDLFGAALRSAARAQRGSIAVEAAAAY